MELPYELIAMGFITGCWVGGFICYIIGLRRGYRLGLESRL